MYIMHLPLVILYTLDVISRMLIYTQNPLAHPIPVLVGVSLFGQWASAGR